MIHIRHALLEDLAALRDLAILTSTDTFAPFNTPENMQAYLVEAFSEWQIREDFDEPGSQVWLAWEDDALAGFCRIRKSSEAASILGSQTLELQRLYVHPHHQGKKIGSKLMQKAIDEAMANGCEWLWLGVWERNFKAQEFYHQWGFTKFSEHVFPMGDDPQTDWMLKKRIVTAQ